MFDPNGNLLFSFPNWFTTGGPPLQLGPANYGIPAYAMGVGYSLEDFSVAEVQGLSQVVSEANWIEGVTPLPADDRRDQPQDQSVLPQEANIVPLSDQEWWEQMNPGKVFPGLGVALPVPVAPPPVYPQPVPPQENEVSWIEDIYDVVDSSLGGMLPGGVDPWFQQQQGYGYNNNNFLPNPYAGMGNPPIMGPFPQQQGLPQQQYQQGCDQKGMVFKKVCGTWRWVKQKRGRRRKLVSQSDAQGLSTLIAILGNGKATQAWIATHT